MTIEPLTAAQLPQLHDIIVGYTAREKYSILRQETPEETIFRLRLTQLPAPVDISYGEISDEDMARYSRLVGNGCCFAVMADGQFAGAALAEPRAWNQTLWVWEFHIAPAFQQQGLGRLLMTRLIETAVSRKLRAIVCETQSHNVPTIRFYRKMGFVLDGIDLSYYTNEDYEPKQNAAIFMKRKIHESGGK
ncbi:GNAT family N-acetyltransferase [Candidatus Leptofilum sp.]|uniref:GNAT family N-acetyltransferase n=1 Tax=Candidatus Leptofilum sp. TaxID=3241576 RepID=UPI003B5C05BC